MIADYKMLTCDSCKAEQVVKETDANRGRLQAMREGWKSFTCNNLLLKNSHTVSRLWDCCPDCQFPDHETVLARVQDEEDRGVRKKSMRG